MDTIIGIGPAGCNIAEIFANYPQYACYGIDSRHREGRSFFKLKKQQKVQDCFFKVREEKTPEEYEKNCPNLSRFLADVSGNVLFVVSGASAVAAITLRVMEQVRTRCKINLLYVKSDTSLLSETKRLHERATFHIFQEYARSGALNRMYVVENSCLEDLIEGSPVIGFYDKLNKFLVSTIHMINIFDNTKSVSDTFSEPFETARISTIGILNIEAGEEKLFFDLENPREKRLRA